MRGFILSVIAIISLTANLSTVKGDSYAPCARVIIDNDFAGDPDGIVALSHHLLSTSVDVVGVIGSFFPVNGMPGVDITNGAALGVDKINKLYQEMGLTDPPCVYKGGDHAMEDVSMPVASDGARYIVEEALRDDTDLPLYVACGGSLNTIASALLMRPEIADMEAKILQYSKDHN